MPVEERGIKILGTPIGHLEHVRRFLVTLSDEHQTLLSKILLVGDVQAALLFLAHCAAGRATSSLRCVDPEAVEGFARRHDQGMLECLRSILHVNLVDGGRRNEGHRPVANIFGRFGCPWCPRQPTGPLGRTGCPRSWSVTQMSFASWWDSWSTRQTLPDRTTLSLGAPEMGGNMKRLFALRRRSQLFPGWMTRRC